MCSFNVSLTLNNKHSAYAWRPLCCLNLLIVLLNSLILLKLLLYLLILLDFACYAWQVMVRLTSTSS